MARQAWHGVVWPGMAGRGVAWQGPAWLGEAWRGMARLGGDSIEMMSNSCVSYFRRESMRQRLPIREEQFLQAVRELAELHGWLCYHTWNSIHSPAGFPDLVLVRPPRIIFAELKVQNRKPTPAQQEWLHQLGNCPQVEVYLWTPADWDTITEVLQKRGGGA